MTRTYHHRRPHKIMRRWIMEFGKPLYDWWHKIALFHFRPTLWWSGWIPKPDTGWESLPPSWSKRWPRSTASLSSPSGSNSSTEQLLIRAKFCFAWFCLSCAFWWDVSSFCRVRFLNDLWHKCNLNSKLINLGKNISILAKGKVLRKLRPSPDCIQAWMVRAVPLRKEFKFPLMDTSVSWCLWSLFKVF